MAEARTRIPWLRIGAESAAIVASILLAFIIDAWWDARSSRAQTSELLQALHAEWQSDLEKVESSLEAGEAARSSISTVIGLNRETAGLDSEIAAQLLLSMFFSTYKPSFGALNSLLLTDLDGVADQELRMAITSWQGVLDEISPEQSVLHETGLVDMRQAMARVAVTLGGNRNSLTSVSDVPVRFGLPADDLAREAFRDEQFLIAMTHRGDVIRTYVETLGPIREILLENLELLDRTLTANR